MPSGVFKPYAGVATAILIFTKAGETKHTWFYNMENDGYSLDDKRNKIKASDLHDIILQYNQQAPETEQDFSKMFFSVSKEDLVENKYNLSFNTYFEEELDVIQYDKPSKILEKLIGKDGNGGIEKEISDGLIELKEILG